MFRHRIFAHEERGAGHGGWRAFGRGCGSAEKFTRSGGPSDGFGRGFGPGCGREGRGRMHGFGPPWARGERGFGGGRERLFEGGDLRLVILNLLAEQPSYGYQIIKRLEERMAGGYTPSAGVIYPTLTMLEEEGLTAGEVVEGKKVFTVTENGKAYLLENAARLKEIDARLEQTGAGFQRGRAPEIMQAFLNLRSAVKARVVRGKLTREQLKQIAAEIEKAAAAIDAL